MGVFIGALHDSHPDSLPGHVFVGFIAPDGKPSAFGFWDMLVENENMSGYVNDDTDLFQQALNGSEHFSMKKFTVNRETYNRSRNFIKSYAATNDYGLITNSCVHAGFKTFNQACLINSTNYPAAVFPRTIFQGIKNGY